MTDLYILGYPVQLEVGDLFVVYPEGRTILEIRHYLNSKEVPNAVVGDSIIAAARDPSVLENLHLRFTHLSILKKGKDVSLDLFVKDSTTESMLLDQLPLVYAKLASSAIGIYLRKRGLLRAGAKFYFPEQGEVLDDVHHVVAHRAFQVRVHKLACSDTSYVLAIDPCYKLEAYVSLSELDLTDLEKIYRVKVRDLSPCMFELVKVIDKPDAKQYDIAVEALKALRRFNPRLSSSLESDQIAKVVPYSYQLREYLKGFNLLRSDSVEHLPFTYLPCSVLYPIASFDQFKILKTDVDSKKLRFWMRPSERYREVVNFIDEILLNETKERNITVGNVKITIKEDILSIKNHYKASCTALVREARSGQYQTISLRKITERKLWMEDIIPIQKGLQPRVALACTNAEAIKVLKLFEEYFRVHLSTLSRGNAGVKLLSSGESSHLLFKSIEDIINAIHKHEFNVVVLVGRGDDEEYAWFEYEISSINNKKIIPQYINGKKIAAVIEEGENSAKGYDHIENYIYNVTFTISKQILSKLNWRFVKLPVPAALENAIVVGVDRTYVNIGKGVGLAVAAVLQSTDGLTISHLPPMHVEDEGDAILQVAEMVKKTERHRPVIFCMNRSFVPTTIFTELQQLFGEQLIAVSASKTHSMSRLLQKQENIFVNPGLGCCAVLEEDKMHGRYLVASTFIYRGDRTIKPTLVEIRNAGININIREVLSYILSTQALCIETPYYVASMPWPLHRADRLCKKISEITRVVRAIPLNLELL